MLLELPKILLKKKKNFLYLRKIRIHLKKKKVLSHLGLQSHFYSMKTLRTFSNDLINIYLKLQGCIFKMASSVNVRISLKNKTKE